MTAELGKYTLVGMYSCRCGRDYSFEAIRMALRGVAGCGVQSSRTYLAGPVHPLQNHALHIHYLMYALFQNYSVNT